MSDYIALKTILTRLSAGLISGAAGTAKWRKGSEENTAQLVRIPPEWWQFADDAGDPRSSFWRSGDATFRVKAHGHSSAPVQIVRYFDVRFEPAGIKAISQKPPAPLAEQPLSSSVIPPAEEKPDKRKPLSGAEQKRFCELLVAVYGSDGATEAVARRAVGAMYPENSVSRDGFREILRQVRELNGPIPLGRPSARGK